MELLLFFWYNKSKRLIDMNRFFSFSKNIVILKLRIACAIVCK
jgi:hypothetical protein